jgi:hypothetical protein
MGGRSNFPLRYEPAISSIEAFRSTGDLNQSRKNTFQWYWIDIIELSIFTPNLCHWIYRSCSSVDSVPKSSEYIYTYMIESTNHNLGLGAFQFISRQEVIPINGINFEFLISQYDWNGMGWIDDDLTIARKVFSDLMMLQLRFLGSWKKENPWLKCQWLY